MLAFVLLRLARIYGDDELEHRAAGVLRLLHTNLSRIPSAFGWALCALDLYLSPPRELAIIGSPEDEVARARARAVRPERGRRVRPGRDVPLLAGKTRVDGKPTLYVCERFACRHRHRSRRTSDEASESRRTPRAGHSRARTAPTSNADRSSVGSRPAISSATCSPTAGACWKPWPEKPVA